MTLIEKYSKENVEKELRERIISKFGENHNIKLALFKPQDNYNDEYMDYEANLILIDNDFNEIEHKIQIYDLVPDNDEEYELEKELEKVKETSRVWVSDIIQDITIKF